MVKFLAYEDIERIEIFLRTKQWWDTIDELAKTVGKIGLRDERLNSLMLNWSTDSDMWIRRVAIINQLLRKNTTQIDLLSQIILNNLGSDDFFINKAIGWALRNYSKTDPIWVRNFINQYRKTSLPYPLEKRVNIYRKSACLG